MLSRTEIINTYIKDRDYKHYLEINLSNDNWNFTRVDCLYKRIICVNPALNTTTEDSYDNILLNNVEQFDLILIDGIHTEEQVLKDLFLSEKCLTKGGIIVLHDCMPPDEWHQRSLADYRVGEAWNGTVWKAVLRTFDRSCHKCALIDADWGCGIIDTSLTQTPKKRELPANLDYKQHYSLLLDYKISITSFLRERTQVFYHLACMGNWQQVFKEQMETLCHSGFRRINTTMLGTKKDLIFAQNICIDLNIELNVILRDADFKQFEKPAMIAIQNYARQHHGYVLYLHSKGVSNPADESKIKWRRLMMRELVEQSEHCLSQLAHYDIIGVNWRDLPPVPHFCGNFWYASTQYLRTLAEFEHYYEHPRYQIWDAVDSKRLGCEFWIGSRAQAPQLLSLAYRNVDFCTPAFWYDK